MMTLPFPYKILRVQNGVSSPQVEQEAISQQLNTISEKDNIVLITLLLLLTFETYSID
jgi:hypothetical protein